MTKRRPTLVSTNYSWFRIKCPVCGEQIEEDDKVWNFRWPDSPVILPVCQPCGIAMAAGELPVLLKGGESA